MMTNPDPASAVASAAIAAAAAGPLSKLVTILWLTSLAIVCHNSLMIIMIMITIMTVIKIIKVTIMMQMLAQVGGCPTGWTSSTTLSLLRTTYCYRSIFSHLLQKSYFVTNKQWILFFVTVLYVGTQEARMHKKILINTTLVVISNPTIRTLDDEAGFRDAKFNCQRQRSIMLEFDTRGEVWFKFSLC